MDQSQSGGSKDRNFIYIFATHNEVVKVGCCSSVHASLIRRNNIIATYSYFEFKDDFQYLRQVERIILAKLQALRLNCNEEEWNSKCELFERYVVDEEQRKDRWSEIYETVKAEIQSSQRCIGWYSSSEMFYVDEMPELKDDLSSMKPELKDDLSSMMYNID